MGIEKFTNFIAKLNGDPKTNVASDSTSGDAQRKKLDAEIQNALVQKKSVDKELKGVTIETNKDVKPSPPKYMEP